MSGVLKLKKHGLAWADKAMLYKELEQTIQEWLCQIPPYKQYLQGVRLENSLQEKHVLLMHRDVQTSKRAST